MVNLLLSCVMAEVIGHGDCSRVNLENLIDLLDQSTIGVLLEHSTNALIDNLPEGIRELPPLITSDEAASILRCTPRQIRFMCAGGTFRAVKAAKSWRINKEDVLRYAKLI